MTYLTGSEIDTALEDLEALRGIGEPKKLSPEQLTAAWQLLGQRLRDARAVVESAERDLPRAEAAGEPGRDRLRTARELLEVAEGMRGLYKGPVAQLEKAREHEANVAAGKTAVKEIRAAIDRHASTEAEYRAARAALASTFDVLKHSLSAVPESVGQVPPDLVARLAALHESDGRLFGMPGVSRDQFEAMLERAQRAKEEEPAERSFVQRVAGAVTGR